MKKKMFMVLSALFALVSSTVSGPVAKAGEIRIATQPIPAYSPLFVAKQKGWIKEELAKAGAGADVVTWSSFPSGPPIIESFAAGQQDIGFLGDNPALIGKAAGLNTKIIALTSAGPKGLAVVVPSKSTIKSPKDLKGKKIAVVKGSYAHHLLLLVLQKGGLTVNDIELINLSQADIATSIVNGNIDAGAVWDPLVTKLTTDGSVRVLADGTGLKKGVLVIIASNDFVLKNREKTKALLKAYQRGNAFIKANPQAAAQLIAEDVKLPATLLVTVLKKFDFNPAIHTDDVQEIKKSEAFLRSNGLIKSPVNVDDFVDIRLNKEAGLK
jgi:sulfonate transport system substrate-binding protein